MFTFKITNPAAPQNANPTPVYLGQANTLEFHFRAGLNEQTKAGDQISIVLDQRLLDNPASLKVISDYWKLGACTAQGNTYVLRCDFLSTFSLSEPFTLKLEGLTPVSACGVQVSFRARFGGRPYSGKSSNVSVMNPPSAHKDLREVLSFELLMNDFQQDVEQQFYLSEADLQTPIANTLHLIATCSKPPLVYDGNGPRPAFILSFTYGEDQYSLTDALKSNDANYNALSSAWNIACRTGAGENERWQAIAPDTTTATPNWRIEGNTETLFSEQAPVLDVFFTHVISRLPEGTAVLYLQWTNFKGYDDGVMALPIPKYKAEAQIVAFNSPQNKQTIAFGQPVALHWKVFGGREFKVSWDKGSHRQTFPVFNTPAPALFYEGKTSIVPNSPLSNFYASLDGVSDENAEVRVWASDFPPPQIKSFSGAIVLRKDQSVVLQFDWLVENLGNDGVFELNGVKYDGRAYNGLPFQLQLDPTGIHFPQTYTLTAIDGSTAAQLGSSSTVTVDLPDWIKPEIKAFSGKLIYDAKAQITGVNLNVQLSNIYPFSRCAINGVPVQVHADGSGVLSIPVNPESPLPSRFVLTFDNLPAPRVSSVLAVDFTLQEKDVPALDAMCIDSKNQLLVMVGFTPDEQLIEYRYSLPDAELQTKFVLQDEVEDRGYGSYFAPLMQIAPDGKQIMVSTFAYFALAYGEDQKQATIRSIQGINNAGNFATPMAFLPDMSAVFAINDCKLVYFKPDLSGYQQPGSVDFKTIACDSDITHFVLSPDARRLYVCDPEARKIWYFDTNNIPQKLTNGIPMTRCLGIHHRNQFEWLVVSSGRATLRNQPCGTRSGSSAEGQHCRLSLVYVAKRSLSCFNE
jgi:hypothetical protein